MISRIKKIITENKASQKKIIAQNNELLWATVYHDSIRGKRWLEDLPLNIGRWAGNYSFFYVLNRILYDYQPKNIIEFGLGESSKFVSVYIENELHHSQHTILEHDENWNCTFQNKFKLSQNSKVEILPLIKKEIKGYEYNSYENIEDKIDGKFDLYIIDGPFGSPNYSRFDIYSLVEKLNKGDEFIIIMDDYHRFGEKQTTEELLDLFSQKDIKIHTAIYSGIKSVKVIGTEKYKYIKSL